MGCIWDPYIVPFFIMEVHCMMKKWMPVIVIRKSVGKSMVYSDNELVVFLSLFSPLSLIVSLSLLPHSLILLLCLI